MTSSHVKTWYGLIATVGGAGLIGKAPGTVGTAVAFVCLLVMRGIPPLLLLAVIVLGTIASDRYAKVTGKEDPGEVVIDEVAGFWVSVFALPATYAFIAFFLFRVVDILKPFPVNKMEKLPGGVGIMADDLCGGIIVNLLMRGLHWFFFAGGFEQIRGLMGF